MIVIGLKLLPLLIATAGGWIGYKFVKRCVKGNLFLISIVRYTKEYYVKSRKVSNMQKRIWNI